MDIGLDEFEEARGRLKGIVAVTPMIVSTTFSKMTGGEVYLKHENLQKTGSFKIRGATNKISKMVESGDRSPVIASSAGNHAQGVAYAATRFGIKSTIVMPETAPLAKVAATQGYGAEVVLSGQCYDDTYMKATEICGSTGAKFIHPYDDPDVIAGQGTVGLEILEDLPDVDIIIVPAGGGGLLSGVATAVKKTNPNVKVYGVQAKNADAIARSFKQRRRVTTETADTIADGIAVKNPGKVSLELIQQYVDDVVTVSDDDIANAVILLLERCKQLVEPAGASPVAAILSGAVDVKGKKVACLLSGGNIDVSLVGGLIERGLTIRERKVELYAIIKDNPRSLNAFVQTINDTGASLRMVDLSKNSTMIKPNEVRAYVCCEVSGPEHKQRLLDELTSKGYAFATDESLRKSFLSMNGREGPDCRDE